MLNIFEKLKAMNRSGIQERCCPVSVYHHFMFFNTLRKKEKKFNIRRKVFYLISFILFYNDSFF